MLLFGCKLILISFIIPFSYCWFGSEEQISSKIGENEFIGYKSVVSEQNVYAFTGIPYAEPPLGDLRFKKPIPPKNKGVFVAKEWPKACPQLDPSIEQGEDCLKLNVWTKDLNGHKPVMVWIHGGGFATGFGQNGEVLAAVGDVVVVTINYRLGTLGFLSTGRDDAPGNVGIWDQLLALEWVNDNIQYFGGNPEQITLFGFSAGSRSVSLHLLSHHSRQLFRNAIMMSGAATSPLSLMEPSYVTRIHKKLTKEVGCSSDGQEFTDEVLECLRLTPVDKLLSAQHSSNVLELEFGLFPNIIFGDQLIPEKPSEMLAIREHKKRINLMIGTTEDEGSWIWNYHIDGQRFALNDPKPELTKEEAIKELTETLYRIKIDSVIDRQLIAELYLQTLPENSDLLRKSMAIALGDLFISCPSLKFAETLFQNDPKHNKIYGYYWTSKGSNWFGEECGRWTGACHGSDVGPAFGEAFKEDKGSNSDKEMSMRFMSTITYFAKNNRPPAQDGIEWPNYSLFDNHTVTTYYEFSNKAKEETNFGVGLKNFICDKIWNKFY